MNLERRNSLYIALFHRIR